MSRGPFAHLATGRESLAYVLWDAPCCGIGFEASLRTDAALGLLRDALRDNCKHVRKMRDRGETVLAMRAEARLGITWRAYRAAKRA